ncbi:hypothetical protein MBLNU13_g00289t1 [Cladosporium sp. NU13]
MVAALKERSTSWSFGPHAPVKDSQIAIEQPPGKYEPVPYAERNYDWSHSSQHARAIPELESHIVKLREQRQQVCQEAEAVRDWLHERETEYHKLKDTASDIEIDKLQTEKHYLEVSSHWYLVTWIAVSECDWMLAGATEHLALARNATQQGIDWPSSPAPAQSGRSPNVKLEHIILGLEMRLRSMQESSRQVPDAVALLKKALKEDPNLSGHRRVAMEGQIRSFEQVQKIWRQDIGAYERVWADAKTRSGSGSDEASKTK